MKSNSLAALVILTSVWLCEGFLAESCISQNLQGRRTLSAAWNGKNIRYRDGLLVLKLGTKTDDPQVISFLDSLRLRIVRPTNKIGWTLVDAGAGANIFEKITTLRSSPRIKAVGPDVVLNIHFDPNDTLYWDKRQWALGYDPSFGDNICIKKAWDITLGTSDVIVGVCDTGIQTEEGELTHPELSDTTRVCLGVDATVDYDQDGPRDLNGHGTHVAGVIGAETNNNEGIAGIASQCQLYINQVFETNGETDEFAIDSGFTNAVDAGARVINLSGGTPHDSEPTQLEDAIIYAENHNPPCMIVASSGNDTSDGVCWPAAYSSQHDNVVAVGASTRSGTKSIFSNWGDELNVMAPGGSHKDPNQYGTYEEIWSTFPTYYVYLRQFSVRIQATYSRLSGTSMAAPHVTGIIALMLSVNPELSPSDIREALELTCDDMSPLGGGWDRYTGYGRVNAYGALKYVLEHHGGILPNGLTIPSGETWTFDPGVTLSFAQGTGLTVYGTLNAVGQTGSGRIHFVATDGTWSGVLISGSGADGSHLEYVDVSDVLTYGGSAVSVVGSADVIVKHCDISSNSNYGTSGLWLTDAGSPEVAYNVINSNGCYGVGFENTSGYIYSNTIEGNDQGGVYCSYYASPSFGKIGFPAYSGNNHISGGQYGVVAEGYCAPYIGSQQASYFGYNSITDNSYRRLRANGNCDILAEDNYWDEDPRSNMFQALNNSTIDWQPPLYDEPSGGGGILKAGVAQSSAIDSAGKSFELRGAVRTIVDAQAHGRLSDHRSLLLNLLSGNPDETVKGWIYNAMLADFAESRDLSLLAAVESQSEKIALKDPGLDLLRANMLTKAGRKIEASALLTALAQRTTDPTITLAAVRANFYVSLNTSGLSGKAKGLLSQMEQLDASNPAVKQATWVESWIDKRKLGQLVKANPQKGEDRSLLASTRKFALQGNFPNPFNPSTTVRYSLAGQAHVSLTIFNVLGQQVAQLINDEMAAGYHEVRIEGKGLPSGVYFYQFEVREIEGGTASTIVETRRMLLIR